MDAFSAFFQQTAPESSMKPAMLRPGRLSVVSKFDASITMKKGQFSYGKAICKGKDRRYIDNIG